MQVRLLLGPPEKQEARRELSLFFYWFLWLEAPDKEMLMDPNFKPIRIGGVEPLDEVPAR